MSAALALPAAKRALPESISSMTVVYTLPGNLYAVCVLTNIGFHPLSIEKPSYDYNKHTAWLDHAYADILGSNKEPHMLHGVTTT